MSIRGFIRGGFLVERSLSPQRADAGADASRSAPALSEVEGLEREIDQLVALRQLYGLTEKDAAVVEGDRPRMLRQAQH